MFIHNYIRIIKDESEIYIILITYVILQLLLKSPVPNRYFFLLPPPPFNLR